jgi:inositol 1,4,5-triphosphate receptor type 1
MEHEQESNVEEFKRSIGDVVMYGDTVQLLHLSSGRYLSVKKTAALVERGNLQVTLLEAPDQGSCFLVKSGYRTRSEGDRVIFGEVVSLGSLGFQGMGLCVGKRRIAEYAMLPPMSMAPEGSSGDGAPEGLQSFEVSAGPIRGRFKVTHRLIASQETG